MKVKNIVGFTREETPQRANEPNLFHPVGMAILGFHPHDNRCYPPCWSTTKRKQTPRDLLFCLGIAQKHRYFHHGLMFNGELSL